MRTFLLAVIGSDLVALVLKSNFLNAASRFGDVSPTVRIVLSMVPAAALGAPALQTLLVVERQIVVASDRIIAGSVVVIVAWHPQDLLLTFLAGFVTQIAVRFLFG